MNNKREYEIPNITLIKFQDKERINDLQNGHIYANSAQYFRNMVENSDEDKQGDKAESKLEIHDVNLLIMCPYLLKVCPFKKEKIDNVILPDPYSEDFLFCMFEIPNKNNHYVFTDEQKEKMLSFGDTALVIKDSTEFRRRVFTAADKNKYETRFGEVKYYNPDNCSECFEMLAKDLHNFSFIKKEIYKYQQEVRFVFSPGNGEDHLDLNIGNISDITEFISSEKILSEGVFIQR